MRNFATLDSVEVELPEIVRMPCCRSTVPPLLKTMFAPPVPFAITWPKTFAVNTPGPATRVEA